MRAAPLAAAVALALAGCGSGRLTAVPLEPGAAPPLLQALARLADSGDKQAQLALGIFYEEGRAVPQDWDRAERLYARAATRTGGVVYVYSAPVTKGGSGSVIPVNTGQRREGLPEAKRRLERLKLRRKLCLDCI